MSTELKTIHQILLGQRKVAQNLMTNLISGESKLYQAGKVVAIDNLLLEIEAAGVVWPDNVVSLEGYVDNDLCTCQHPMACGRDCRAPDS